MDDSDTRKLDAIVGAAIKALVESGAGDEVVGSFAASHRAKVAKILGHGAQVEQPPDLLGLVTQAVEAAIGNLGIVPRGGRPRPPPAKRVYVSVAGRKTSLTIGESAMGKLIETAGDRRRAMAVIQGLAESAPADVDNRSKWVEERMLGLASAEQSEISQRH